MVGLVLAAQEATVAQDILRKASLSRHRGRGRQIPFPDTNASRLAFDGLGNQLLPRLGPAIQVSARTETCDIDQTIHRLTVGLQSAVGVNMSNLDAALVEFTGDEERPMAFERLFLRAHERDVVPGGAINDARKSASKRLRGGDPIENDAPVVIVTIDVVGAAAQLPSQVHICDSNGLESGGERFSIVLGVESAVGRRPNVGQGVYPMRSQETEEDPQIVVGMADGEDLVLGLLHDTWLQSASMTAAINL